MEWVAEVWKWLQVNWAPVVVPLVLIVLWGIKAWKENTLGQQLRLAVLALLNIAKGELGKVSKEQVLDIAYVLYDAEELFKIPDWLNWAIDAVKKATLGSKEEFGEKVWREWQKLLAADGRAQAVMKYHQMKK